MINKASIRNFKSLRDVQVDLEQFTVFVGPNASGKSSVLQGLDLLCRYFRTKDPESFADELKPSVSHGADDQVELAGESGGKWYRYRSRFWISTTSPPPGRNAKQDGREVATDLSAPVWMQWKPEPTVAAPLPRSILLRLETSRLISAGPISDPTIMRPDGTGLHTALAAMALNDPDSWQALQEDLRKIIPAIRRLRHTRVNNLHEPTALLFDTIGAASLPADQVSEGTLLVLGLLAALHAPSRPSLILLDDLDRGLHPKAQRELINLLRGLLASNPELQIVATTHSPYMLDCMETNEVRMTVLGPDGATECAALASHPQFEKWKDEMTPGEMWSVFGEKWLTEAAAV